MKSTFLEGGFFNEYDILHDSGTMKAEVAKQFAEREFKKFRVIQDRNYESDFDRTIKGIKENQSLPIEGTVTEEKKHFPPLT